jgi:hypothetical protein
MRSIAAALLACAAALPAGEAPSRIKLTTLPDRERTVVRFEDTGHVLVEETRTLTLDQGPNQIDFTWLGVGIDRGSIQLLRVEGAEFTVIRTAYPPGDGNSLVWEAHAKAAGTAKVRISYLLSGLARELAMRAVIAEGKPEIDLRVYQRLINNSGETFDAATLRAAFGDLRDSPLATGEIRQQLAAKFASVPFRKTYTCDAQQPATVQVHYVLDNTAAGKLGVGTLPGGKVRLFQATGSSEAFLGEDNAKPTAQGEELKLRIGDARDLATRRVQLKTERQILQRDHHGQAALWHDTASIRWEIENFAGEAKTVRLVERCDGDWDVVEPVQALEKRIAPEKYEPAANEPNAAGALTREDVNTLYADLPVPPNRRVVFTFGLRRKHQH